MLSRLPSPLPLADAVLSGTLWSALAPVRLRGTGRKNSRTRGRFGNLVSRGRAGGLRPPLCFNRMSLSPPLSDLQKRVLNLAPDASGPRKVAVIDSTTPSLDQRLLPVPRPNN